MRERIGYRAPVGVPKQPEQTITQCGKHLRSISLRRMPSIFAKRHIAHVMGLILNRPMAAPQPFDRSLLPPPAGVMLTIAYVTSQLRFPVLSTIRSHSRRTTCWTSGQSTSSICALPHVKRRVSRRPCPFSVGRSDTYPRPRGRLGALAA